MSSLDKMLAILDLFDEAQMSVQLEHAVLATGTSKATAYRYIQSLCNRGLLAPATGGSYVLGPRVIELDRLVRKMDPLLTSASRIIREASAASGLSIMLCSFYGQKVMCANLVWQEKGTDEIYERGRPMPMFRGAMAKIILANLTPYQLRSMMLWHADSIREAGLGRDWEEFRSTMTRMRRAGFCVSESEVFEGLVGISAPIFNAENRVLGSVVFIVAEERFRKSKSGVLTKEIVSLGAAISADIARRAGAAPDEKIKAARPRRARAAA